MTDMFHDTIDKAIVIDVPTLIKAVPTSDGTRLVEVEASCEKVDLEGDVILQKALLDSAGYFIKPGMVDLDHFGEIGERMGLDPAAYIIGRPLAVNDLGEGRTGVRVEIMRSADGSFDPVNNRYDGFWKSLQSQPPVTWYASIYGFPTDWDNCTEKSCTHGATRYLIKSLTWQSLALTRHPMNNRLTGSAKIVKASQYIELAKSWGPPPQVKTEPPPMTMKDLRDSYDQHISKDCPHAGPGIISRGCFKQHFEKCEKMDSDSADILGHALTMSLISDLNSAKR